MVSEEREAREVLFNVVEGAAVDLELEGLGEQLVESLWRQHYRGREEG